MNYKLSDVCTMTPGFAFKSKDFSDIGAPVIKITHIRPPSVSMEELSHVDISKYSDDRLKKFLVHEGDFVFAMTGATIGKIGKIPHGEAYINQRVLTFKADEGLITKDYLYYLLSEQAFRDYVVSHVDSESAQPNISAKTVGQYMIDLPSLDNQKRIADILSIFDQKIDANSKQINTLHAIAETIFEKRFSKQYYGSHKISDYMLPRRGKPLLSKDTEDGNIPVVAGGLEPSTYHNKSNTLAPVITISASGANAGFVRLWGEKVWSSDSSYIDKSVTKNVYFWYVLLKKRQKEIYDLQTGSAQAHIYPQHIGDMSVGDFSDGEMQEYDDTVTPIFESISKNEFQNKTLLELRNAILPKLVHEKITIRNDGED